MELAADLALAKLRCAPFHASTGADPVGTAGAYDAFLVVEVPLPWDKDVSLQPPFSELMDTGASVTAADGRRWRPMAVVPEGSGADGVRVTAYELAPGRAGFVRREWRVAPDRVVDLARALLGFGDGAAGPDDVAADRADPPAGTVDLLVCTHGRRDTCCGSTGAAVHQELAGRLAGDGGVRLSRCSHTGGHRFAATALTFPDGYAWAHLSGQVGERIARRSVPPSDLRPHCRGFSGLDGGPAQAADRVGLTQFGWDWPDAARSAVVVAHERDTLATTVRLSGTLADGRTAAWDVRVEVGRWVPTPTCGVIEGPEFSVEPEWVVTEVAPVPGGDAAQ